MSVVKELAKLQSQEIKKFVADEQYSFNAISQKISVLEEVVSVVKLHFIEIIVGILNNVSS